MSRRIFITGASGFAGSAVVDAAAARGFEVNALVRAAKSISESREHVRPIVGDLFDAASLDRGMAGAEAAIHLVGIIAENRARGITFDRIHHEGTAAVLEAAKRAGIKRFIYLSALGTRPDAASNYHRTKWLAEEAVRGSGLDWTIVRPSLIHGPRGEFMLQVVAWAKKRAAPWLFMPYFAGGLFGFAPARKVQPVFVGDVARACVEAIGNPRAVGQTYALAGADVFSWPEMYRAAAKQIVGHRRLTVAMPAWFAKTLARTLPAKLLPFNEDQVIMSQEDNVGDASPFARDFGWTPAGFESSLASYVEQLR